MQNRNVKKEVINPSVAGIATGSLRFRFYLHYRKGSSHIYVASVVASTSESLEKNKSAKSILQKRPFS